MILPANKLIGKRANESLPPLNSHGIESHDARDSQVADA